MMKNKSKNHIIMIYDSRLRPFRLRARQIRVRRDVVFLRFCFFFFLFLAPSSLRYYRQSFSHNFRRRSAKTSKQQLASAHVMIPARREHCKFNNNNNNNNGIRVSRRTSRNKTIFLLSRLNLPMSVGKNCSTRHDSATITRRAKTN